MNNKLLKKITEDYQISWKKIQLRVLKEQWCNCKTFKVMVIGGGIWQLEKNGSTCFLVLSRELKSSQTQFSIEKIMENNVFANTWKIWIINKKKLALIYSVTITLSQHACLLWLNVQLPREEDVIYLYHC